MNNLEGKIIFITEYDPIQGHVGANLFKITLQKFDYSDFYAEVQFIRLANISASYSDTLRISGTWHNDSGQYEIHLHQLDWKDNEPNITQWVSFYLRENSVCFFGRYPGKFCGFAFYVQKLTGRALTENVEFTALNDGLIRENELRPEDVFASLGDRQTNSAAAEADAAMNE
jgi:hypothetical protein